LYGGLKVDQARRLKELERKNQRLKKAISDLTLDKLILAEAAKGNFQAPRVGGRALSTSGTDRGVRASRLRGARTLLTK